MGSTEIISLPSAPEQLSVPFSTPTKIGSPHSLENDAIPEAIATNDIDDFTDQEIADAIDTVLRTSIYTGSSRELMVNAINDTVHGRMSLTQAAAKFGIPFSTIHPYVKKLRQRLGLAAPPDVRRPRAPGKRKAVKAEEADFSIDGNADAQINPCPKKPRKKRSPPPGYIPFKQIVIPEHWKLFPEKMKDAVWSAVSFCNYDNVEKKYRLCHAILDVMIGQKTLKSAAHNNNIPFTTLQTYFHRSRITLEKYMENDEEVCKAKQTEDSPTSNADISLDDSLTLLSTLSHEQLLSLFLNGEGSKEQMDAFRTTASTPSTERSTGKSVDAVSDWLISKKMSENGENECGSPTTQMNGEQTGSRKRKPQIVKRVNDGLNVSTTSNSSAASQMSDFLAERFGLTMMKVDENGQTNLDVSDIEKLHQPSVINCEHKLAKTLVNYYANHVLEVKEKSNNKLLRAWEDAIIGVSTNGVENFAEVIPKEFDKHLDIINNLMTILPQKFAIFKLRITPDVSNWAKGKDLLQNQKLFHGCLLSEPPETFRELMTSYLRRQIVDYVEFIASAGFPVDQTLISFLLKEIVKDRSLPDLYQKHEYDEQYRRIINSEKLKRFFQ